MAYIPRSSLIPNETSGAIPTQMKKRRTIHAFGLISSVLFIVSLLASVGVFLYNNILEGELESAKSALGTVSGDEENRVKIEEIRLYDERLQAAEGILKNHISPIRVLEEIEDSAKRTVEYNSFSFTYDPGFEALLTLSGFTEEFSSVALQKMQFFEDVVFKDFAVEGISTVSKQEPGEEEETLSRDGVAFTVTGTFDPEQIRYFVEEVPAPTPAPEGPSAPAGVTETTDPLTTPAQPTESAVDPILAPQTP